MDRDELLDLIATESAGLVAAVEVAGPDAPVPGCPDWVAGDLAWHIAEVQDFWGYVVRERSVAPGDYEDPERSEDFGVAVRFARDRTSELVDVLHAADPATPVWTWTGAQQDAAWVVRRMAHEAAFHRFDAEQAAGTDHRLDAVVAADGIDEFLTWFAPHAAVGAAPVRGTVHLHCTDTAGEWTVTLGDDEYAVTHEHAKGDAAIRGSAHDLLTVLWRRASLIAAAEVFGDADLAAAFIARTRTG